MRNRVLTFVYAERPAFTAGATVLGCLALLALAQSLGLLAGGGYSVGTF